MVKTGTVVTLKVAKFAAGYHGLGSLLLEPTSERHSGKGHVFTPQCSGFFFCFNNSFSTLCD